ncbi:tyrosine--tRNA ligase [Taibaiella chishuiensis]|uniref:Tyrosine--tRNA ligase n=1 Tax=Taibaiella chishuiensis TaxID=1434707 RepID=A0A2P8D8C2_9BACT|nr:tyrosine--tRNA ligase [Taibaiella chishuiensis]PSK93474.1 tyrosyl-tRNA synthetase [Taibaiella chishuiensis]
MHLQDTLAVLQENVAQTLPENAIGTQLRLAAAAQRPLVIKLGFDPTAPDLHLGHAVVLRKLRQFQDLGHTIVIIIGDFTARIGDPTGKNKSRPPLSAAQVAANAQTYIGQLGKILDTDKCHIRFNSEWLEPMDMAAVIGLLSQVTLAQILQRTDFHNRFSKNIPITMHELIYPLLQGHDSLQVNADIEMGGTDQLFNCSMGRHMQEAAGQAGQAVLCMPLLRGIDGSAKMSKSEGNTIGLTDAPEAMFGKVMSIPDALLPEYITLATHATSTEKQAMIKALEEGLNPMQVKKQVAFHIVQLYHNPEAALAAQRFFEQQFQQRNPEHKQYKPVLRNSLALNERPGLVTLCKALKPDLSKAQLRRLIGAASVTVNNVKVTDPEQPVDLSLLPVKIKLGKRDYFEIS